MSANKNASTPAKQVLNYLTSVSRYSNNKVVSGQHISHDGGDASANYTTFIEGLNTQAGKYPVIVGSGMTSGSLSGAVSTMTNVWKAGGFVQIDAHFDHPWLNRDSFVADENAAKPNLLNLIPGDPSFDSVAYIKWKTGIDRTADALQQLRDKGIPVLWRPLHEVNGTWFWWGHDLTSPDNTEPYKKLWQSLFDYYTNDRGLNNLLWVYAVSPSWVKGVTAYYPGSEYVDIVGMDIYSDSFVPFRNSDYRNLKALGKPFALTETGPSRHDGLWDTQTIATAIRTHYPDCCYFMQWPSWVNADVALVDNLNASALLNNPMIITRDEVNI